ncbi:MAG: VOC family protein, partial [Cyanobacteria bacterium J06648_11]
AGGTTIALHHAPGGANCGEATILSFNVEDIHAALAELEAVGGTLEGTIREPSFGKVAAVRSPEGHLISLLQPAAVAAAAS